VPPFDLALGLRVVGRAADMIHALVVEIIGQVSRDAGRAVVTEQPRLGDHRGAVAARHVQRQVECVGHILCLHRRAELPGDDVSAVIIQDCRQVDPASRGP